MLCGDEIFFSISGRTGHICGRKCGRTPENGPNLGFGFGVSLAEISVCAVWVHVPQKFFWCVKASTYPRCVPNIIG